MFLLDTDTVTRVLYGDERITERIRRAGQVVGITVISRIEVLQGRFASVLKAENGNQLVAAQERLARNEADLRRIPVLPIDAAAAAEFDRLRQNKKLKKVGRADLLIAAMTLASRATLVTRNVKDFRQVPGLQVENWID